MGETKSGNWLAVDRWTCSAGCVPLYLYLSSFCVWLSESPSLIFAIWLEILLVQSNKKAASKFILRKKRKRILKTKEKQIVQTQKWQVTVERRKSSWPGGRGSGKPLPSFFAFLGSFVLKEKATTTVANCVYVSVGKWQLVIRRPFSHSLSLQDIWSASIHLTDWTTDFCCGLMILQLCFYIHWIILALLLLLIFAEKEENWLTKTLNTQSVFVSADDTFYSNVTWCRVSRSYPETADIYFFAIVCYDFFIYIAR